MPHRFFNPLIFGTEFIYTAIIVFLCFLIYYKTRDIYKLTKHKGVSYFRNTFLLFGLSYAIGFLVHLFLIGQITLDIYVPRLVVFPVIMVLMSYLSTMALFYLVYSLVWKSLKHSYFLITSNLIAIIFSITAFMTRSPVFISILQILLLISAIIIGFVKPVKKKSKIRILYILIILFWIINLVILGKRRLPFFEIKLLFQIISAGLFGLISYKVLKWVR